MLRKKKKSGESAQKASSAQSTRLRRDVRDLTIEVDKLSKLNAELVSEVDDGYERPAGYGDNIFVFGDEDDTKDAFDEFFCQTDPYLEKVRSFLLD